MFTEIDRTMRTKYRQYKDLKKENPSVWYVFYTGKEYVCFDDDAKKMEEALSILGDAVTFSCYNSSDMNYISISVGELTSTQFILTFGGATIVPK